MSHFQAKLEEATGSSPFSFFCHELSNVAAEGSGSSAWVPGEAWHGAVAGHTIWRWNVKEKDTFMAEASVV